ncbi:MAG TPA: methylated-DNA--[protein]-cysteine S-methyltransferase [Longimicrobiaceae bacterium]|nr:methylated-DNA--[protein]-cysteine S-methyltransferase [Longimicrobiaceae bacterium]
MTDHARTHAPDTIRFTIADSSLGRVLVARSARGLSAVLLGDRDDALERGLRERFPRATLRQDDVGQSALAAEVTALVESPAGRVDVPLDLRGTEFQRSVWSALREIPAGETVSYSEIARRIGRPRSVRAVAGACGANPIAVVVPCHRALGSDGRLSGYRWGIERKRMLLEREARA